MWETQVRSLGREDPLEKEINAQSTNSFFQQKVEKSKILPNGILDGTKS